MSQKLPVNNFEWIKDTFQFNEDFIKNYNLESDKEYFLKVDVQYLKKKFKIAWIKVTTWHVSIILWSFNKLMFKYTMIY